MLPGTGSVVAGNSGRPQLENGAGSRPFSGHGGAGGWSVPIGAKTCWAQIAFWVAISFWIVSIRIGFADAVAAPRHISAAASAATPPATGRERGFAPGPPPPG